MKLLRALLIILLIVGIALFGLYLVLDSSGLLSPEKCAKNGGKWDEALELCRE